MPARFTRADEVEIIAADLIPAHHKPLHEFDVRIAYLFSDQAREKDGRAVIAEVAKVSGRNAFLARDPSPSSNPLTFVCRFCLLWAAESARTQITAEGLDYDVCRECGESHPGLFDKVVSPFLVERLEENSPTAESVEAAGPPNAGAFFVITAYGPHWNDLTQPLRRAVVDDMLCRCRCGPSKGGLRLWLRKPLEVFPEIIERHGLWCEELEDLARDIEPHLSQMLLGGGQK